MAKVDARKGMPSSEVDAGAFRARFEARFADPAFAPMGAELERLAAIAWDAYSNSRKAPHTQAAGDEFHDPAYQLATDWIAARAAIQDAQARHDDGGRAAQILIVNGSPRSEHTCPGEMSKTWRLVEAAREVVGGAGANCEVLDLSRTHIRIRAATSTRARRASRPRRRSATGHARVIPTTPSARSTIG